MSPGVGRSGFVKIFTQALFQQRSHIFRHIADSKAAARLAGGFQALIVVEGHQDVAGSVVARDGNGLAIGGVQELTGIARDR